MSLVVGVRFAELGKMYYFDPGELTLELGDSVLVETTRGREVGEVVMVPQEVQDSNLVRTLKKVIRREDKPEPKKKTDRDTEKEQEAFRIAEEKIKVHDLAMKLIDAEYAYDGSKLIFYFSAENRIDFRELVKDLASVFRTRIELRQIGVRDEAKKIGGLGPCGRPCCCNAHMDDFVPVSIKMAKEQGLSLSPTKISGLCGRLMCCLHYEQEHYREMRKLVPRIGSYVESPAGAGEVCATDILTGRTKVRIALQDGSYEMHVFSLEELSPYTGETPPEPAGRPEPEPRQAPPGPGRRPPRSRDGQRREPRRGAPRGEKKEPRRDVQRKETGRKPAAAMEHRRRPHRPRKQDGAARKGSAPTSPPQS